MNALFLFPNTRLFTTLCVSFLTFSLFLWLQIDRIINDDMITFFDIPGESFLLQFKEGHNILVDGGLNSAVVEKIFSQIPFWERRVDAVIVSHPDKDHLEGIISVLKNFSVGTVFVSGVHHDSHLFSEFQEEVKRQKIPLVFTDSISDFRIGENTFDVLFPQTSFLGKQVKKVNNSSLIIRYTNKKTSFLLTGDIENKTEHNVLITPVKVKSDTLKVAHHGSKTSSSEEFLRAVSPKKAVICVHKDNQFGHPHQVVIDRFFSFSIPVFTTKSKGNISLAL